MRHYRGLWSCIPVVLLALLLMALSIGVARAPWRAASAQPLDDVVLVHVNPDGTDFTGNPYCPQGGSPVDDNADTVVDRWLDDCSNVTGLWHVIRTEGFNLLAMSDPVFHIEGVSIILTSDQCNYIPEVTGRPNWDPANDDQWCLLLHSSEPGETWVTLTYSYQGSQVSTDAVLKEWDDLVDTVILKAPPDDEDADGDIDADDHHLADQQGTSENDALIWDDTQKRLRSAGGPIHLVEIVHGEHDVLINAEWITLHHPTEGAIFYASISSDRGCTYFTDPLGLEDFGDQMNGVSVAGGRFVGPRVAPAQSQGLPAGGNLNPDSHTGTSPQGDYDIQDIHLDTFCEEQATISIWAGYPGPVGSMRLPAVETIHFNWVILEEAKQPQIRWAGEQIILEKRWALPDHWFPNPGQDPCPLFGSREVDADGDTTPDYEVTHAVAYRRLDPSPGGLEGAYVDADEDGYLDTLNGSGSPDDAVGDIDVQCHSKALYLSDVPGQVDVEARLMQIRCPIPEGECTESLTNKHAFLVWYLKIYQVKLTNVDGERARHNAGDWSGDVIDTSGDTEEDTLNASADTLLRVQVKGWFFGGNHSSRGAVCVDMDGDGDEAGSEPGVPYPLAHLEEGCADPDDEILDQGHWVLPDDLEALAGPLPGSTRLSWDVMSDIDEDASPLSGSGFYLGPKATIDSHDNIVRPNVPCSQPFCGRKTVDPDGELTVADAIMPVLRMTAQIADPADAGFLKEALKASDLNLTSLHQYYMLPYEPEIPPFLPNADYGWDSWACRLQHIDNALDCPDAAHGLDLGPYEFFDVFSIMPAPGPLENTGIGNQGGQSADDPAHPRKIRLYTDNRGWGFFFANGDYNLSFDDCVIQALFGTPDCAPGDVVGTSTVQVIGDYPYLRKHPAVVSNPVVKTWTWGGFKQVTAEPIDATHTAIIAHLKDRDGFCKYDVDVDDDDVQVQFSPSANPVQHEEITFLLNTEVGSIVSVSSDAIYSAPRVPLGYAIVTGAEDGVIIDRGQAVALAEDARVLEGMELFGMVPVGSRDPLEDDECQAWIVVEHPPDRGPNVSVQFDDPEGTVVRHWPPTEIWVTIDIKPGSYPNSINLGCHGVIPVAVLTTDDFDAATVDPGAATFANASPKHWALEDVDNDGDVDLILHFKCQQVAIEPDATDACLKGSTYGGWQIEGCDSVRLVPPRPHVDSDADGFADAVEVCVGTDPLDDCPDDPSDDAWPPDIGGSDCQTPDTNANILDVLCYKPVIGYCESEGGYDPRYNLEFTEAPGCTPTEQQINILDVLLYKPVLNTSCVNP